MTDTASAADARWAAAEKLADGVRDDGFHARRRRTLAWVIGLIAGSWVLGFVIGFAVLTGRGSSGGGSGDDASASDARLVGQIVILALGLLVGIVGFVWARRTGHYITRWRAIPSPLDRAEKKSVRRQIAGKEEADPRRLPIVIAAARQARTATLGVAPLYASLVLIAVSVLVGSSDPVVGAIEVLALVLFLIGSVQLVAQYRKAGSFLRAHDGGDS